MSKRHFNCYRVRDIESSIHEHTSEQSRFEPHRAYLGMSDASLTAEELVEKYNKARTATLRQHLLCYKGYQMEDDLVRRYREMLEKRGIQSLRQFLIPAFDGLVQGHPDLIVFQTLTTAFPVDIKSVPQDSMLPLHWEDLSYRTQMQMQAYLHFGNFNTGRIITESRENGFVRVFDVTRMPLIGQEIEDKYTEAIRLINGKADVR